MLGEHSQDVGNLEEIVLVKYKNKAFISPPLHPTLKTKGN